MFFVVRLRPHRTSSFPSKNLVEADVSTLSLERVCMFALSLYLDATSNLHSTYHCSLLSAHRSLEFSSVLRDSNRGVFSRYQLLANFTENEHANMYAHMPTHKHYDIEQRRPQQQYVRFVIPLNTVSDKKSWGSFR